jgi:uncharacterized membrane protein
MREFLTKEQELEVAEAIRAAEHGTSGEIRVVIISRWIFRMERHAWRLFERLGMRNTRRRNGALIVLFARRRRFMVLGDSGLNEVVQTGYWEDIASEMTEMLGENRKLDALTTAIRKLGETMAGHWPPEAINPDELANAVVRE